MYEELVKALRDLPHLLFVNLHEHEDIVYQAADAIEELSSQLDDFKRLCLPLKENRLYKYFDGSFVEVFLILSEPPKAET